MRKGVSADHRESPGPARWVSSPVVFGCLTETQAVRANASTPTCWPNRERSTVSRRLAPRISPKRKTQTVRVWRPSFAPPSPLLQLIFEHPRAPLGGSLPPRDWKRTGTRCRETVGGGTSDDSISEPAAHGRHATPRAALCDDGNKPSRCAGRHGFRSIAPASFGNAGASRGTQPSSTAGKGEI